MRSIAQAKHNSLNGPGFYFCYQNIHIYESDQKLTKFSASVMKAIAFDLQWFMDDKRNWYSSSMALSNYQSVHLHVTYRCFVFKFLVILHSMRWECIYYCLYEAKNSPNNIFEKKSEQNVIE